jgi:hypothetical protein
MGLYTRMTQQLHPATIDGTAMEKRLEQFSESPDSNADRFHLPAARSKGNRSRACNDTFARTKG